MKRFFLALALCAALLCTGCTNTVELASHPVKATLRPDSGLKSWSSAEYNFSFSYHHTWYAADSTTAIVTLVSPAEDATPGFREYIAFGGFFNTEQKTAAEIADAGVADMQKLFPSVTLEKSNSVQLSGANAELRIFKGHIDDSNLGAADNYFWHQYTWLDRDISYSLTFACTEKMSALYLPEFEFVKSTLVIELS